MHSGHKYFRVPFRRESAKEQSRMHVLCVYDASGSMEPYWEWVAEMHNQFIGQSESVSCRTITFDTQQYECKDNALRPRILAHGGGGTCIPEAFYAVDRHLDSLSREQAVTVVFISDGVDNHLETLEQRMKDKVKKLSSQI